MSRASPNRLRSTAGVIAVGGPADRGVLVEPVGDIGGAGRRGGDIGRIRDVARRDLAGWIVGEGEGDVDPGVLDQRGEPRDIVIGIARRNRVGPGQRPAPAQPVIGEVDEGGPAILLDQVDMAGGTTT